MGISRIYGPLLFLAGAAVLAVAIARGEASLSLVLVFPVVATTTALGALGIVLVVAAFFVTVFTWPLRVAAPPAAPPSAFEPPAHEAATAPQPAKRWGGILFLGPIPIVFGSDARVTRTMLLLGVVLFLALLGLTLFLVFQGP